jgi:NADH-quinone oxidoreductase subunit F
MTSEALEGMHTLDEYRARGCGYAGLEKVLSGISPSEITEEVKISGLRGRGGAGFPAGVKWGFIPKDTDMPVYLVCNADEGEPGTFKDRWLLRQTPHRLIEGVLIASYAIGCSRAFIYMRDEFAMEAVRLNACLEEARRNGLVGTDILGSGWDCDITIFKGAGAYICGEETALLNSIEGRRGLPRVRPPFPAIVGLYDSPTIINNVETLSNLPDIAMNGGQWYASYGTEESSGTRLFSVSGRVARPGVYEVEMGVPWSDLLDDLAGGPSRGKPFKALYPGGSSTPMLTAIEAENSTLDFESAMKLGTFLGSGGTIVLDSGDDIVEATLNVATFYKNESCGQCTPCREGCRWMVEIIKRIASGRGSAADIDQLLSVTGNITGNTICAFGDGAAAPVGSAVEKFRSEFEARTAGRPR